MYDRQPSLSGRASIQLFLQVNKAAVVAVGPGRRNLSNGELIPVSVKEGETVLLPEYGGQTIKLDSEE